jgi:hypothetical protein
MLHVLASEGDFKPVESYAFVRSPSKTGGIRRRLPISCAVKSGHSSWDALEFPQESATVRP